MKQIKHMRHQQSRWFYAAAVFFLLLFYGVSPETVRAQWTTGTDNINNTNTGNVGIGTTTPPSKLTVSGGDIHVQTPTLVSNGSMGDIGFGPGGSTYGGVAPRAFIRGYFQGAYWYSGSALAFFTHGGGDITNGNTNLLERMRIDKDGNVGIGTSSPAAKLQIYNRGTNSRSGISIDAQGTQAGQQAEINLFTLGDGAKDAVTAGTKGWHLAARGNAYAGTAEQNDLQLYFWNGTGVSIRQYWDAGGNVGIGTTATPSLLNLFRAGASPGAPADLITFSAPGNSGTAEFNVAQILADTNGADSNDSYLAVNPINTNGTGYATGLIVKAGGNVGIGKTAPGYKLDVNGEINATGLRINGTPVGTGTASQWTTSGSNVYYNTGNIGIGTSSPLSNFHIYSTTNNPSLLVESSAAISPTLEFRDGAAQQNRWRVGSGMLSPTDGRFGIFDARQSQYRFVIDQTGRVGIGTSNPSTAKLVVSGAIGAEGLDLSSTDQYANLRVIRNSLSDLDKDLFLQYQAGPVSSIRFYSNNNESMTLTDGKLGIGKTNPSAKLDVEGSINASGAITGGTINAKYQDVAEWVPSSQKLAAGTVVALDPEKSNQVLASSEAYDTKVAGVISAQPGIALGESGEGKVLVATTGRVKVRVDASHAPIKIGDLLVTSNVPGVAMKSMLVKVGGVKLHRPGTLIGKALEPLATGKGEILVLLSLQ